MHAMIAIQNEKQQTQLQMDIADLGFNMRKSSACIETKGK